jgi:peptidoglycan hydrolase-like protein with peptidoglycan-binding domain
MTIMSWNHRAPPRLFVLLWSLLAAIVPMTAVAVVAAPAAAQSSATVYAAAARPTVRYGSRGATVTYLQQRLTALHYDVGGVDGVFGNNTLHAVYAFQKVQRLGVDGVVGPKTWAKITSPYQPKARYRHTSAAVEVDLAHRVVFLTRAGAVTLILDASPGKASTPTPTGNYAIYRRINGWRQSSLGLLWRPNYFHGGYALHGSTSVPTYAASHGCVRLTVPAMNRIWAHLFIGEPFHVYR